MYQQATFLPKHHQHHNHHNHNHNHHHPAWHWFPFFPTLSSSVYGCKPFELSHTLWSINLLQSLYYSILWIANFLHTRHNLPGRNKRLKCSKMSIWLPSQVLNLQHNTTQSTCASVDLGFQARSHKCRARGKVDSFNALSALKHCFEAIYIFTPTARTYLLLCQISVSTALQHLPSSAPICQCIGQDKPWLRLRLIQVGPIRKRRQVNHFGSSQYSVTSSGREIAFSLYSHTRKPSRGTQRRRACEVPTYQARNWQDMLKNWR